MTGVGSHSLFAKKFSKLFQVLICNSSLQANLVLLLLHIQFLEITKSIKTGFPLLFTVEKLFLLLLLLLLFLGTMHLKFKDSFQKSLGHK